ncbi:hypothetical protein TeGR_g11999 [Tetraparma gracilis]|uniref:Sugar transporter n=1 Tax=Tetraparma gracilis TaxID=2962635 RepID=A0ABQ6M9B0_9STRA|nr:hypothetical protein TeGR_g11999 [Tetraparma gracilis]
MGRKFNFVERGIGGTYAATAGPAEDIHEKLPLSTKMTLGVGESVQAIYTVVCGFFLNAYLLEVACLDPKYVGAIQLIQGSFDAFNDPLIGTLSDRTRTRWGRRRPWLLFASLPLGVAYFGIWNTIDASEEQRFAFYLLCYMCISIGITCVQIGALVPELTLDYDERTSLSAYRLGVGNVISFIAVMTHAQIIKQWTGEDEAVGYRLSGAIFGTCITAAGWFTFWNIEEKFDPEVEDSEGERLTCMQGLMHVFKNKSFVICVAIYLCGPTAIVMVQTNLILYCKYILDDEEFVDVLIAIVQGMALVALPLWNHVGQWYGKKSTYYIGGALLSVALCSLYFIKTKALTLVASFVIGSCLSIPYVIPYSMLPDVIEEDEIATGKRREGIYFGFFTIFLKLSVTLAMTFTNLALSASGYEAPVSSCGGAADEAPDAVINVMRVMVGPVPACFFLLAMYFVYLFPITKESHTENAKNVVAERERRKTVYLEGKAADAVRSDAADGVDGDFALVPLDEDDEDNTRL